MVPAPQSANLTNGHTELPESIPQPAPVATTSKKGKGKKDKYGPDETSKLLAAKISQLEQDAAGEKDQEAEIGAYGWLCLECRIFHSRPKRILMVGCFTSWANNLLSEQQNVR